LWVDGKMVRGFIEEGLREDDETDKYGHLCVSRYQRGVFSLIFSPNQFRLLKSFSL